MRLGEHKTEIKPLIFREHWSRLYMFQRARLRLAAKQTTRSPTDH